MDLLGDDHLKYYRIKQALENLDGRVFQRIGSHGEWDSAGEAIIGRSLRTHSSSTHNSFRSRRAFSSNRLTP